MDSKTSQKPVLLRKPAPGKGMSSYATVDVVIGTVLAESLPLLSAPFSTSESPGDVVSAFAQHCLNEHAGRLELLSSSKDLSGLEQAIDRISTNAMQVEDRLVLYPECSTLNHSCWPNAAIVRPAGADPMIPARVIAIAPISSGDEVCIAYRSDWLHLPTSERRARLQETWGFLCTCDRCLTPRPVDLLMFASSGPCSAEQQVARDRLFLALSSAGEDERGASWLASCDAFLQLPLGVAHWQKNALRELALPYHLAQSTEQLTADQHELVRPDAQHDADALGAEGPGRERKCEAPGDPCDRTDPLSGSRGMCLLRDHIKAAALVLPPLLNTKLVLFDTYQTVLTLLSTSGSDKSESAGLGPVGSADVILADALTELDPSYPDIKRIFADSV